MKKVELLSPAGDYNCFVAAINAGADAVYLGGKSFGARSFAGNFEEEEIIRALKYAHLHNVKIYLTFNTLIKEREWNQIYPFLEPLYLNGLDGIIIQDLGLIPFLQTYFPDIEIHISTQMTVTDVKSAKMLYEMGIKRIVPARELSLTELKEIKNEVGVELETFIHGALCYCYSGQCLFSSFLGGRSGNRGKCAQPCRLPYQIVSDKEKTKELYPLSLKDLCTIDILPEMIEAGIDSFKIEGRMKSPQYVAGVTSIYRKYIDEYYDNGKIHVTKKDKELLNHIYVRSNSSTGYYKKYNGKDMITLSSPSYSGNDEEINSYITQKYVNGIKQLAIDGKLDLRVNQNATLLIQYKNTEISVTGDVVLNAQNRPLTKEDVEKQMRKTGNEFFCFRQLEIEMDTNCFMPVKQLNELRRTGLNKLKEQLLERDNREIIQPYVKEDGAARNKHKDGIQKIHVFVQSDEQVRAISHFCLDRIYVDFDLIVNQKIKDLELIELKERNENGSLFLSLPRIIRKKDDLYLEKLKEYLQHASWISGILVKNLEELFFIKENGLQTQIALNHTIYTWNQTALQLLSNQCVSVCAPLELSRQELNDLEDRRLEIVVYAHLPMMVTANCIYKTSNHCIKEETTSQNLSLLDRYKKRHPVYHNCLHCYNEIYNAIPLSLHNEWEQYVKDGYQTMRIDFTIESEKEVKQILSYYCDKSKQINKKEFPITEYTTGHSLKGAL